MRFFNLLPALQDSQIGPGFVGGLSDAIQRLQVVGIHFAGICLPGDGVSLREAHFLAHAAVEFFDLFMIPPEQLQETGLRAGRAFDAPKPERFQAVFDFLEIQNQIVTPKRGPLAHGRGLGRLQMRETQTGQIAIRLAKSAK